MAKFGWEGQLGWAEESTWGTAATINRFLDFASGEFEMGDDVHTSRLSHGSRDRLLRETAQGRRRVAFSANFDAYYKGLGLWFKHVLGGSSSLQQGATAAWGHTFTRADALPIGLTTELEIAPDFYKLLGCKVNELVVEGDAAGPLRFMVNGFAKDYAISGSGATFAPPASLNGLLTMFHQCIFKIDTVEKQYRSFRLRIFNDMFADDFRAGSTTGNRLVRSLDPRDYVVEGSLVLTADDAAQLLKIRDFATAALKWTFTGPLIETPHFYTWDFDLPKVRYRPTRRRMEGPNGESLVELEFEAFKDTADALTVILMNTETAL